MILMLQAISLQIVKNIVHSVEMFCSDTTQFDDITLVAVKKE